MGEFQSSAIKFLSMEQPVDVSMEGCGPSMSIADRGRGPRTAKAPSDRIFEPFAMADAPVQRGAGSDPGFIPHAPSWQLSAAE
jgi:hypothetical protein